MLDIGVMHGSLEKITIITEQMMMVNLQIVQACLFMANYSHLMLQMY